MNDATAAPEAKSLLSQVPKDVADLTRDGGGYSIQIIYLPGLMEAGKIVDGKFVFDAEAQAHVMILDGEGAPIDELTIPASEGITAFHHPSGYSHKLCEYLAPKNFVSKN